MPSCCLHFPRHGPKPFWGPWLHCMVSSSEDCKIHGSSTEGALSLTPVTECNAWHTVGPQYIIAEKRLKGFYQHMGGKEGESGLSCLGHRPHARDYTWCLPLRGHQLTPTGTHAHARAAASSPFLQMSNTEVEKGSQLAQDHPASDCQSSREAPVCWQNPSAPHCFFEI